MEGSRSGACLYEMMTDPDPVDPKTHGSGTLILGTNQMAINIKIEMDS
jgi:hypothetical protein